MSTMPPNPPPYPPPYSRAQWKAQRAQWKMQARMQRNSYRMLSRGSLAGPLLLVGIGIAGLLLTTHTINAAHFWQWYGRWWPLILIGAGCTLALESILFSSYARIRLGGGVILLGILLAAAGVVAAHHSVNWTAVQDELELGNNVDLAQMLGAKHETTEQVDHDLPANATVILQNARGDVTVTAGPDDRMHIKIDKVVYTNSDSEAQEKLRQMEPLITSSGDVVTVRMPSSDSQMADLTVTLPSSAAVQVRAGHGDISIDGRKASVTANSDHGDVQLDTISGEVHATMQEGDFAANNIHGSLTLDGRMNDLTLSEITGLVALDGDFFGDVHLEHLSGPVHFHSSRTDIQVARLNGSLALDSGDLTVENAAGPITVATREENIELHQVNGDLQVHNSNGAIEVSVVDPIGPMNIENRNGSVQVTLPEDAKFSLAATAVDGETHTDFNLATENGDRHSTVSGSVGGGGPLLHITAEKGDITLHKRSNGSQESNP